MGIDDIECEIASFARIEEIADAGDLKWQIELCHYYEKKEKELKSRLLKGKYKKESEKRLVIHTIKKLRAKALCWYKKAASLGSAEAQYALWILGGKEDSTLLERAIALGYYKALSEIGAENDAIKAAPNAKARSEILYTLGKKLLTDGKNANDKKRGEEMLKKSAALRNLASESNEETISAFENYIEECKKKYTDDFEAEIEDATMRNQRLLLKSKKNVASVFADLNSEKWREMFERFLSIFTDEMRSADEIIAAAKLYSIDWASAKATKKVRVNGDEVIFFLAGKVDFRIVANIADMRKIVVTDIFEDFASDKVDFLALEEIVLPKRLYDAEAVSAMFQNTRLEKVDNIALNIHDGFAFSGDGKTLFALTDGRRTEVTIPAGVERIGKRAFANTAVQIVHIGDSVKAIADFAFSGCRNLADICLPDSAVEIGRGIFSGCTNLKSAQLGNETKKISSEMFLKCRHLKEIAGTENIEQILDRAFYGCETLEQFDFHKRLRVIGEEAFALCANLREVTLNECVKYIGENAFPDTLLHLHFCGTDKQWTYLNINNAYNQKLIKILSTAETEKGKP